MASDVRDLARRLYIPVETISQIGGRAANALSLNLPMNRYAEQSELELKISYLHYALSDHNYLFVLENFQEIDHRSYEALLSLLDRKGAHRWILEFTIDDYPGSRGLLRIDDLIDDLQARCDHAIVYWLERLSEGHVASLIAANDNLIAYVLDRYRESDGNLRPLMDLAYGGAVVKKKLEDARFNATGILPLQAVTDANIRALADQDRLVLYWMHILGRLSDYSLLRELTTFSPLYLFVLDESISALKERKLIIDHAGVIQLAHDRVGASVESVGKGDRLFLAAKSIVRKRLEEIASADRKSGRAPGADILSTLCVLYNELGEHSRASLLLSDVALLIARSGRTDRLVDLLRIIEGRIEEKGRLPTEFRGSFFRRLCLIYYAAGFPEDALRTCLQLQHSIERSLIQAILSDLIYQHESALHIVENDVLPNVTINHDLYIPARLTRISILRSLNQHELCERELRGMLLDARLALHRDYALIMRASEMVLPFGEAEPFLRSAADDLIRQSRNSEAARTLIICVFVQSIVGKFEQAAASAAKAQELLTETFNEQQCLLNNIAASRMLLGLFDDETLVLLQRARLTAVAGYDQIVILNNLMIFHAMARDGVVSIAAASYLEKALAKSIVREKDILRILYFNLAQFWRDIDAARFKRALKSSQNNQCSYEDQFWEQAWSADHWSNDYYRGVGRLPFMPTFLSYWTVDLEFLLQRVR